MLPSSAAPPNNTALQRAHRHRSPLRYSAAPGQGAGAGRIAQSESAGGAVLHSRAALLAPAVMPAAMPGIVVTEVGTAAVIGLP